MVFIANFFIHIGFPFCEEEREYSTLLFSRNFLLSITLAFMKYVGKH